jgi:hypothetical protein
MCYFVCFRTSDIERYVSVVCKPVASEKVPAEILGLELGHAKGGFVVFFSPFRTKSRFEIK